MKVLLFVLVFSISALVANAEEITYQSSAKEEINDIQGTLVPATEEQQKTIKPPQAKSKSADLQIVPNNRVCMVTNMVFPKPQIPVNHSGKTYYGCCENCKKTLSEDASARVAVDPISGKTVDKAKAVIAAREDGSVIYFESQKTFKKYMKTK